MSFADEYKDQMARIKVVGVGGAGGNIVNCMIASKIEGIEFVTLDTKDREVTAESLIGVDMVFITAGMGGGTGTDTAPVIAKIAKELPLPEHFGLANDVIKHPLQGITDLIIKPGLICNGFEDIKTVVQNSGRAALGIGVVKGKVKGRAVAAVKKAMANILTERSTIEGARGILCSITADKDLSIREVEKAVCFIYELAHKDDNIVIGAVINPDMQDEIKVTIIATGFDEKGGK